MKPSAAAIASSFSVSLRSRYTQLWQSSKPNATKQWKLATEMLRQIKLKRMKSETKYPTAATKCEILYEAHAIQPTTPSTHYYWRLLLFCNANNKRRRSIVCARRPTYVLHPKLACEHWICRRWRQHRAAHMAECNPQKQLKPSLIFRSSFLWERTGMTMVVYGFELLFCFFLLHIQRALCDTESLESMAKLRRFLVERWMWREAKKLCYFWRVRMSNEWHVCCAPASTHSHWMKWNIFDENCAAEYIFNDRTRRWACKMKHLPPPKTQQRFNVQTMHGSCSINAIVCGRQIEILEWAVLMQNHRVNAHM